MHIVKVHTCIADVHVHRQLLQYEHTDIHVHVHVHVQLLQDEYTYMSAMTHASSIVSVAALAVFLLPTPPHTTTNAYRSRSGRYIHQGMEEAVAISSYPFSKCRGVESYVWATCNTFVCTHKTKAQFPTHLPLPFYRYRVIPRSSPSKTSEVFSVGKHVFHVFGIRRI